MIQEIAIEPAVLDCWSRYEYFMADCGVEKGRLVAEFPLYHWKKRVWDALKRNPKRTPRDEKKVEYHLQHTADAKLVYVGRSYQFGNAPPWLDQAIREHAAKPFRAIVSATKVEGLTYILPVDDFDKELAPLWQISASCSIKRTPEELASLTSLLCAGSKFVKLLDPHLDPGESRFKTSFSKLLESICHVADYKVRIEVHTGTKQSQQDFADKLQNDWPTLIPMGRKVLFHRWREEPQGEQLHRRLILSERGGILVEAGLDTGHEGQTTTASILSASEHLRFWKGLSVPTAVGPSPEAIFEFKDTYDVTGVPNSTVLN